MNLNEGVENRAFYFSQAEKAPQENKGTMNGAKGMKTIKVLNTLPNPNNASLTKLHRAAPFLA